MSRTVCVGCRRFRRAAQRKRPGNSGGARCQAQRTESYQTSGSPLASEHSGPMRGVARGQSRRGPQGPNTAAQTSRQYRRPQAARPPWSTRARRAAAPRASRATAAARRHPRRGGGGAAAAGTAGGPSGCAAAAGWRFRNGATARPTAVRAGLSTARMRRMRAPPHRKEEMTGDGSSPKSPRQLDGGCHIDPSLAPHDAAGSGVAGGTTVRPCLHGACTACIDTCYPMGARRSDHILITRIPWPLGQGSRLGSRDARSVHLHSGVGGGLRGADVSPTIQ